MLPDETPSTSIMADFDSRASVGDASQLGAQQESLPYPSSSVRPNPTPKRPLDEVRDSTTHRPTSSSTLGQFSFAPATRTTVVTTTTTTTTNFPPLFVNAPRSTRDLDSKHYPLASTPTPPSLRHFRFDLGGKSVIFNEPEEPTNAIQEVGFIIMKTGTIL
jgi:F-box and WD-40 domain protein CDC4